MRRSNRSKSPAPRRRAAAAAPIDAAPAPIERRGAPTPFERAAARARMRKLGRSGSAVHTEELHGSLRAFAEKVSPLQRQISHAVSDQSDPTEAATTHYSVTARRRFLAGFLDLLFALALAALLNATWWLAAGVDLRCDADGDGDCDANDAADVFTALATLLGADGGDGSATRQAAHKLAHAAAATLSTFVGSIAHTLVEAGATWVSLCATALLLLLLVKLLAQGQTPGKFLLGLATLDPTTQHAHEAPAFRLLASVLLLPLSAVQLGLLGAERTVLDGVAGSEVHCAIRGSAAHAKVAKAAQSGGGAWRVWLRGETSAAAQAAASDNGKQPTVVPLAAQAMSSFSERAPRDIGWVAAYAGATCALYHNREVPRCFPTDLSAAAGRLLGGQRWAASWAAEAREFLVNDAEHVVAVGLCTLAAAVVALRAMRLLLGRASGVALISLLPVGLGATYLVHLWGAPCDTLLPGAGEPVAEALLLFLVNWGWGFAAIFFARLARAWAPGVAFCTAVVGEACDALTANMPQLVSLPLLEGALLAAQLWLVAAAMPGSSSSSSGSNNSGGGAGAAGAVDDGYFSLLRALHMLWTICTMRAVISLATANCTGKWYFRDAAPAKFGAITRSADSAAVSCTKQLGSAIYGGAVSVFVASLHFAEDRCDDAYHALSHPGHEGEPWWHKVPLWPLMGVLWMSRMLLHMLAAMLERVLHATFTYAGLTGEPLATCGERGERALLGHLSELLAAEGLIKLVCAVCTAAIGAATYLVLPHAWAAAGTGGAQEAAAAAEAATAAAAVPKTAWVLALYLVLAFGWALFATATTLLTCVIEDQRYASAQLRAAATAYQSSGGKHLFGFIAFVKGALVFAVFAFGFELLLQQEHTATSVFAGASFSSNSVARVVLHAGLILHASFSS